MCKKLQLLNAERDRLLLLAESAEAELEKADASSLPEEAEGKLRSAAGKARLLAKQKMQQFEGLCHKNIVSFFVLIRFFFFSIKNNEIAKN